MQIRLDKVTKRYKEVLAADNFSVSLPDGKLICLLGPSGCGKSTILNLLCGITDVTEGRIFFDEKDVTTLEPDKRNIGMVFQHYALYPHLTVLENIAFPLEVQKVPKKERNQKAEQIAKIVHVETLLKRYPGELSGGQQQRVAIARALIKNPQLLLMDEPLSNLDARLRLEMREEIKRIQNETKVTTIFVTHDQEEALAISDRIILMKEGKLIQNDESQKLYENPNCKFTADFLGNPPINDIELAEGIPPAIKNLHDSLNTDNKNIVLSIRPESFIYKQNNENIKTVEAVIKNVSVLGKEQIVQLEIPALKTKQFLRAIFNTETIFAVNQQINISLSQKGVFIFDAKTGGRIS